MISKKIKAGALQLVTFIVVIIALLLLSFIVFLNTHKLYRLKTEHIVETVKLTDKGISHALKHDIKSNDTILIDLKDEDYKSLKIHKTYWGTFEKMYSKGTIKSNTLFKVALLGHTSQKTNDLALYINDNNVPLVLAGGTMIKGNAYLPERGVRSGQISGQSYYNDKYIYGKLLKSQGLPKLDVDLIRAIDELFEGSYFNYDSGIPITLKPSTNHKNSFTNPLQYAFSDSDIYLYDIILTGHIVIQSKTKIVVDANATLNDVVLIAPDIEISSNVEGSFHAFADKHINVGNNVTLRYPSTLILKNDYNKENDNKIEINGATTINGTVVVIGKTEATNYSPQLYIDPLVLINGMIYCEQNLELRGSVHGMVYTDRFIVKENGSVYQNHLFNAKIDAYELSNAFVGLPMLNANKNVAKWLY